jgi:glycosyltransferase involved in cell wall biosynthesis
MTTLRPKLLLISNFRSSFIAKDATILAKEFTVIEFDFFALKKWQTPFRFAAQLFFLLRHIFSAQLVVCQFAGYHSLLPLLSAKVFGKPSLIVSGGTDAHFFPNIGDGNWQKQYLKTFTAWSFRLATHIAPKHSSLMLSDYAYDNNVPTPQGISARLHKHDLRSTVITNGYDPEKWKRTKDKKPFTFLTISGAWEYGFQQQLKGIDLILEVAPQFPQCTFYILGLDDFNRIPKKPDNVVLLSAVKNNDLPAVYSEMSFYLQLSMAEGFPNALCESMLCECVPIGSAVFSIPEIIGDTGFVLKQKSVTELAKLLDAALKADIAILGKKARQRIAENYNEEKRSQALLQLSHQLLD